jgi:8-oxo-dGTP diphosphatase
MINYKLLLKKASEEQVKKLVVGALIVKETKILLLKRPMDDFMGGIWELPSGNVEKYEDLCSALIREVLEETGLEIDEILKYVDSFDYESRSGKKARQFNFLIKIKNFNPVKLTEHDDCAWVEKYKLDNYNITDNVKKTLSLIHF